MGNIVLKLPEEIHNKLRTIYTARTGKFRGFRAWVTTHFGRFAERIIAEEQKKE